MHKNTPRIIVGYFFIWLLISCSGAKDVSFESPVDTTDKEIAVQTKQIFEVADLKLYASNQFSGARLNGFKKINDSTVAVEVQAENVPINMSPYYAFRTWADTPGTFYYSFHYPKPYFHRYIPKIKRNGAWSVLDSLNMTVKDSIVTIKVEVEKSPITIAAQKVQSTADVRNWYTQLATAHQEVVKVKSAGKSTLGRDQPVLEISNGSNKGKQLLVFLTRQHPPEVTGYFAFQEFVKTILESGELRDQFLEKYYIIAFPIMNPDGVDMGHWRHNAGGVDLNRDWSIYNQPETKNVANYVTKSMKKNKAALALGLDFHSTWYDVFYTNKTRENTSLPGFEIAWFEALEREIPGYKVNEAPGNSKRPTSKGWFLYGHKAVGITYEIGDKTPQEHIEKIGKVSATQMMNILLNNYIN